MVTPQTPEGWEMRGDRLAKKYLFPDFAAAMDFMARVAPFCDQHNHHPEWKNIYNQVFVELTTHDAGGVTEKDIRLAQHMDAVSGERS